MFCLSLSSCSVPNNNEKGQRRSFPVLLVPTSYRNDCSEKVTMHFCQITTIPCHNMITNNTKMERAHQFGLSMSISTSKAHIIAMRVLSKKFNNEFELEDKVETN